MTEEEKKRREEAKKKKAEEKKRREEIRKKYILTDKMSSLEKLEMVKKRDAELHPILPKTQEELKKEKERAEEKKKKYEERYKREKERAEKTWIRDPAIGYFNRHPDELEKIKKGKIQEGYLGTNPFRGIISKRNESEAEQKKGYFNAKEHTGGIIGKWLDSPNTKEDREKGRKPEKNAIERIQAAVLSGASSKHSDFKGEWKNYLNEAKGAYVDALTAGISETTARLSGQKVENTSDAKFNTANDKIINLMRGMAKNTLERKLDEMLYDSVQKTKKLFPNMSDEECIELIRGVITGNFSYRMVRQQTLEKVEDRITELYVNFVGNKLGEAEKLLNTKIDDFYNKTQIIDTKYLSKIETQVGKATSDYNKAFETFMKDPDGAINGVVGKLDKYINKITKIDDIADKIDGPFRKLGIDLGLGSAVKQIVGSYQHRITSSIGDGIKAYAINKSAMLSKYNQSFKDINKAVIKARADYKAITNRWKNTVKDRIGKELGNAFGSVTKGMVKTSFKGVLK